jgi:DNA-binding LacI/PurR family transcriptional regulator
VRFGSSVTNLRAHTITSDQSHCSRLAYEKLKELGHTRIGYVSDELFETNTKGHFREGYLNAQEELSPRRGHLDILMLNPDSRSQPKEVLAWIKKQKPEAIVTSSSTLHGLLDGLGIRVPADIVVATTSVLDGNFDMGADQNSYEIGRVAVSTLASLIIENERGIPTYQRRILVEGRWVAGKGA